MTSTVAEHGYENTLSTRKTQKENAPAVCRAAIVVGLLVLIAAGAEAWGAWRLREYIIRLNSFRAIDAFMAPPNIREQLFRGIGISEVVLLVWMILAWLGAGILGFSGIWTAARRRFGWRMLWTGAIATIVAAGLTVAGGYVLEHYAGFPPQAHRVYAIAFLIHSAPGWVILGMWLIGPRYSADWLFAECRAGCGR